MKENHLRQVDLARFLGITESSVSSAANGRNNLSEENLSKILNNKEGWDTSALRAGTAFIRTGDLSSSVIVQGNNRNSPIDNRHYYSDSPDVLRAQVAILDERIKEKDAQIKEKDAQIKEKDAQIKEKDAQIRSLLDILQKK